MPTIDIAALLHPVSTTAPCGIDPVHEPAFQALMAAARGKPDQEFGKTKTEAKAPEWAEVQGLAMELLARSKDLRVAMQLLRAWTDKRGLGGFASGLQLIHGLLDRHWEFVHPQLDAEENNDPTSRLNALAALVDPTAVPLAVRRATFDGTRMSLTGRDVELAAGGQQPAKGESKPTKEGLLQALRDAQAREPGLLEGFQAGHLALQAIEALLAKRVGHAAPNLEPLRRFAGLLSEQAAAALDQAQPPAKAIDGPHVREPETPTPPATDGAIRSREDAMNHLQQVCDWIEKNEPGHPAPMLIQRARRLMAKSFMDIVKDIFPEGVAQVQKLAGVSDK